jgi:hypothetical protein
MLGGTRCPRCNKEGSEVGYKFEVPRANDAKSWSWLKTNWDPVHHKNSEEVKKSKWSPNESQLKRYGEVRDHKRRLKIEELEIKYGLEKNWLIDHEYEERFFKMESKIQGK